jgi:hypothetical protein
LRRKCPTYDQSEKLTAHKASQSSTENLAEVVEDYALFQPMDYLAEYHMDWDEEDKFASDFLHSSFESIAPQNSMIDVGGGPTLYQLISARNKVNTITCAEFLEVNRREIEKWRANAPDAFNWDPYFKHYLRLEKQAYCKSIEEMKISLRSKLSEIVPYDFTKDPSMAGPVRSFDIVSSHFMVEHLVKNDNEFETGLRSLISLGCPGGYLILSFLREADNYKVGPFEFYTYRINEEICERLLVKNGCRLLRLERGPAEPHRHYQGTFSLFAQRL